MDLGLMANAFKHGLTLPSRSELIRRLTGSVLAPVMEHHCSITYGDPLSSTLKAAETGPPEVPTAGWLTSCKCGQKWFTPEVVGKTLGLDTAERWQEAFQNYMALRGHPTVWDRLLANEEDEGLL
jgi:hypothetical protein